MQIGDLVFWYSKGIKWSYAEDIANPGIVLDIKEKSLDDDLFLFDGTMES